jgi:hypothetical protein
VRRGRQAAAELFGLGDVEKDGAARHALPEQAAIELQSTSIRVAAQDHPEGVVDEGGVAEKDRLETRLEAG